jgi:hypothetical protein
MLHAGCTPRALAFDLRLWLEADLERWVGAEPGVPDPGEKQRQIERIRSVFRADQAENLEDWQKTIHSQVPRTLYHYTTATGLRGILESHSLWASDVRFMNDASELTYAVNLIAEVVGEVLGTVTDERLLPVLPKVPTFANVFEYGLRPFCACMCERGDLLSQWRGYTAGQIGYSLGLDLRNTRVIVDIPRGTFLRKVLYDEGEQRSWARRITETWLQSAQSLLDAEPGVPAPDLFPYPAIWTLQEALIEPHLSFKNPAFSEEKEWRLIKLTDIREELRLIRDRKSQERFSQLGIKLPESRPSWPLSQAEGIDIKFRQTSLGFVPYIELGLKHRAGVFTGRLPLEEVIQGPTAAVGLSLQSLTMYLESHDYGFPMTNIHQSAIPLR